MVAPRQLLVQITPGRGSQNAEGFLSQILIKTLGVIINITLQADL